MRPVMPSERTSVVAKAQRYRQEPWRFALVSEQPFLVHVRGVHADHWVGREGDRLVCDCARSRRQGAGGCAHVLAAAHHFPAVAHQTAAPAPDPNGRPMS